MRILVKGANWLGDAVMSLPALKSLRTMHPRAHIAVLTRKWLADLYRGAPYVDEAIPYDTWLGGVRAVKKAGYETAIILPRSFSSAFMIFTARIPRRVGYRGEARRAFLTDPVRRDPALLKAHRVHYYHHLLTAIGDPPKAAGPELVVPDMETRWAGETLGAGDWIAVNPGATYGLAKQWFPERFIDVAKRLGRGGLKLVVVGGPGDAALGGLVALETGGLDLSGRTTILQLAAVLARCRLLVTNDTGPMHVADAVGTPIVAIYGPTDWVATPPFGRNHAIVRKDLDCSPCQKRVCPLGHHNCMKLVSADDVYGACRRFL